MLGLLVACGKRSPPGENAPDAKGAALPSASTKSLEDYYIRQKVGVAAEKVPAKTRSRLVGDLKKLHGAAAVGAQAVKPETANAIELSRLEILARSAAEAAGVYAAPSTAELQQAYQQYLQTLPASEFHAAHILMATESAASTIITKRQGGADFAEVAKSDSADDSKSKGGDLGWIHPGHLPPQFLAALKTLQPGEYTKAPVHTPYDWHVIRLGETRAVEPPPFEPVKAQLATNLQLERYQRFLEQSEKGTVGGGS